MNTLCWLKPSGLKFAKASVSYTHVDVYKSQALILLFAILYVEPFANFFHLTGLNITELGIASSIACVSVLWFEVYNWVKRLRYNFEKPC